MRKISLLALIFILTVNLSTGFQRIVLCAEPDQKKSDDKKIDQDTFLGSSGNALFSVSTDELNSADSLNRVSGSIDRGFSSKEQTYKSLNQHKPGPYAASEDKFDQNNPANY